MPSPRPDAPLLAIAFLGLIGFADAAYLTAEHYFKLPLPCSASHGCDTVLTSPYAMIGPIPLAFFGVVFYLLIMALALYLYAAPSFNRSALWALLVSTIIGLSLSIVFVLMQAFLIHAFCYYCLGSALDTLLLFFAGLWLLYAARKISLPRDPNRNYETT